MAPKVSTRHTNLSALKLPPCGPVVLINLNICIITEGINFKAILKENCPIALENRCIFTKKMINMKLKMILMVLLEFAHIRLNYKADSINALQFKQMMNLTLC